MSEPSKPAPPTAADYDEHAGWLIRRGKFQLARLAVLTRNSLRAQGDTSTEPSPLPPITARDYLDAAEDWEAEGNHKFAAAARARAAELQLGEPNSEQQTSDDDQQ